MNCEKCGQEIQRLNNKPLPCCACSGLLVLSCIVKMAADDSVWTRESMEADVKVEYAFLLRRTWQEYGMRHHYWTPPEYDGEPLFDMRA